MPENASPRPLGLTVAAVTTILFGLFFLGMAGLSLASGHGAFSGGVALALVLWGLMVGGVGVALLRGARWAMGPVVAAALLHVFSFAQFATDGSAPQALIGAVAALAIVVGALHPISRAWLNGPR